jgi:hypothetical protein
VKVKNSEISVLSPASLDVSVVGSDVFDLLNCSIGEWIAL